MGNKVTSHGRNVIAGLRRLQDQLTGSAWTLVARAISNVATAVGLKSKSRRPASRKTAKQIMRRRAAQSVSKQ